MGITLADYLNDFYPADVAAYDAQAEMAQVYAWIDRRFPGEHKAAARAALKANTVVAFQLIVEQHVEMTAGEVIAQYEMSYEYMEMANRKGTLQ